MTIKHKFNNYKVPKETSIIILGTFHPAHKSSVDFFYSRPHNFLWTILPACFNHLDLKKAALEEKHEFVNKHLIGFHDIIVTIGKSENTDKLYADKDLDNSVLEYSDTINLFRSLKNLNEVYFTRKSFGGIPNIANRIAEIRNYCVENNIRFSLLPTPSRYITEKKIEGWKECIIYKTKCY